MNLKQYHNLLIALFINILFANFPQLLHADIKTDGSLGAAQKLTGPDYLIPETLGTVKGNNLFHSFDKFSIVTGESATFTGSDAIKNVISRVTGGEKSEIDGTLRSIVGKADFYFINPDGIVFGKNAKVDVPAAFHVSTANELTFQDGSSFKASKSESSTLTQARPEAFGFLGGQSANIEINGSTLEFKPESKVSLTSSKDIGISSTETKQAGLLSEEGEIELKATGDLTLNNAKLESSGNGGGKITVTAGSAKLENKSRIVADNAGDKNSDGGVNIDVNRQLELSNGSYISSTTWSKGDAGNIRIIAGNMKIDRAGIASSAQTDSEGKAGTVEITVDELLELTNGAIISSNTWSKGDAGNIKINAGSMKINGQGTNDKPYTYTEVSSSAKKSSLGNAGTVEITVSELLELIDSGSIASNTFSKGDAGNITIKADTVRMRGLMSYIASGAGSDSSGTAGSVKIVVTDLLEILYGAGIVCNTEGEGDAGNINVHADNIRIDAQFDGQGYKNITGMFSRAKPEASGYVGNIDVTADSVALENGARISIEAKQTLSSEELAIMPEKFITMNTNKLSIENESSITSESTKNVPASNIEINSDIIYLKDGQINSSVLGTNGDGGNIIINENTTPADFLIMQNGRIKANTSA